MSTPEQNDSHLNLDAIPVKRIAKGDMLQMKGETKSKTYYVKSGLLRSYTIDKKGKEHIFMFAPENWIISDVESMANETEAELFIDALEDSEVYPMDQDLISTLTENPVATKSEVTRLIRRIGVLQRRVIMLMSSPAIDRYHHFTKTYPGLLNRVSLKMIASYLGITPEALSKIRAEIAHKKES